MPTNAPFVAAPSHSRRLTPDDLRKLEPLANCRSEFERLACCWLALDDSSETHAFFDRILASDSLTVAQVVNLLTRHGHMGAAQALTDRVAKPTRVHEYREMAEGWHACGDVEQARRCMEQGEAVAKDAYDWGTLSRPWWEWGNAQCAKACVRRAEGVARDFNDWMEVAYRWELYKEKEESRRILIGLESRAFTPGEGLSIAWKRLALGDRDAARALLVDWQPKVRSAKLWLGYAEAWRDAGDGEVARECLRRAEGAIPIMTDTHRWKGIADEWRELGDEVGWRSCLLRWENLAASVEDWRGLVNQWEKLGDAEGVVRCAKRIVVKRTDYPEGGSCTVYEAMD